jgi:hypothetical protein
MSAILQTLLGGALTIVGGLAAVWWQTRRADDVARRSRAERRREEGLLALNLEMAAVHPKFDALYRSAENGQSTSQYLTAITLLAELRQFWEGNSSGVIGDSAIVGVWIALDSAARERLPTGSGAVLRQRALSTGDSTAGQRFVRDLGQVLGLLGEFKKAFQQEATFLAVSAAGPRRP